VRLRGDRLIRVECKNGEENKCANGDGRVEVQKTRASKGDPASRYYEPSAVRRARCLPLAVERPNNVLVMTKSDTLDEIEQSFQIGFHDLYLRDIQVANECDVRNGDIRATFAFAESTATSIFTASHLSAMSSPRSTRFTTKSDATASSRSVCCTT